MIILATAIILSLNSSNISGKAGEAKISSDLANKKEAASVYLSEYEIKKAKGKIDSSTTADEYVKSEAKKAGLDTSDIAVTDDGIILAGIAAMFKKQNIPIGTKIDGYKLNNTISYTTSGKENTCDSEEYTETEPQPATVERQAEDKIIWKYFGIDENGEALIVGGSTADSPKMTLGGKGAFLYGSQELNKVCEAMYSSNMGNARNINIDDVMRVLEYTGGKGSYYSINPSEVIDTPKAKTINEIANEIGYDMSAFANDRPEAGKDIGTYKSNSFEIHKTRNADKYNLSEENTAGINFIYTGSDDSLKVGYWLASSCVFASFNEDKVYFGLFRVTTLKNVSMSRLLYSTGISYDNEWAIRPVVSLNPSVQIASYDGTTVTLK